MKSHHLILESRPDDVAWLVEWDNAKFVLKEPDGTTRLETTADQAHHFVDLYELYAKGKISVDYWHHSWVFRTYPEALADLREIIRMRLASDPYYGTMVRRQSQRAIHVGLAMCVVGGGLLGLRWWYESQIPHPRGGEHWTGPLEMLTHYVLVLLAFAALMGPVATFLGLREWLRFRRAERAVAAREQLSSGDAASNTEA